MFWHGYTNGGLSNLIVRGWVRMLSSYKGGGRERRASLIAQLGRAKPKCAEWVPASFEQVLPEDGLTPFTCVGVFAAIFFEKMQPVYLQDGTCPGLLGGRLTRPKPVAAAP